MNFFYAVVKGKREIRVTVRSQQVEKGNWMGRDRQIAGVIETALIVTFIVLGIVGILHHELWRDETQAWLLARDSSSPLNLLRNSKYEGHPLLWHYCLYGLSRISHSLVMMQGFNLLLAVGSVVLIVKRSPFTLLQKGLIVFGYFTLYEYSMLARSYGLSMFLVFLFCALYCQRRPLFWGLTVALALLANTSILGLSMSLALAIALYYRLTLSPERKALGAHLFVVMAAWLASAFQIGRSLLQPMGIEGFDADARAAAAGLPTAQGAVQHTAESTLIAGKLENLDKVLQIFLKGFLPLPTFNFHFWNEHPLENTMLRTSAGLWLLLLSALLVGLLLLIVFQLLQKTPLFLSIYGLGSLAMLGLFIFVHRGTTRHHGHLFILLLACLWLAQWSRRHFATERTKIFSLLFTGLLFVQAFSGIYAYTADILYPFSASYQTAQIIKTSDLNDLPIIGINQRPVSPLSAYLDRPIYYPEARQFGSFWDISYPEYKEESLVVEAIEDFAEDHSSFLAVLTAPVDVEDFGAITRASYLTYVGPSIVEDEAFYLYRIDSIKAE